MAKLASIVLKIINIVFLPFSLKPQVAVISRQADKPTLDLEILLKELDRRKIKTTVTTKTLNKSLGGMLGFGLAVIKQMHQLATSKVVVIDGYCIPVSVLPKKKGQTVLQMWHAMGAVKKFGWQVTDKPDGHSVEVAKAMNMHGNYDYFLAPCEITGEIFAEAFNAPKEKVIYGALPRVDYLRTVDEARNNEIFDEYPQAAGKTNVLYVPTFRKNAQVDINKLAEGFDYSSFNLIIKKHFLDKSDYSWAKSLGAIVDEKFSSMDWIRVSTKIVTDYSAIAFEAASVDKELYIYQPDFKQYENNVGLNIDLFAEAIGAYASRTSEELIEQLAKPYDMADLYEFKNKYLAVNLEHCTEDLCDAIEGWL